LVNWIEDKKKRGALGQMVREWRFGCSVSLSKTLLLRQVQWIQRSRLAQDLNNFLRSLPSNSPAQLSLITRLLGAWLECCLGHDK
jgi:hypothetical protein